MMNQQTKRIQKIYKQSKLKAPYKNLSLAQRYWIYQWERLPLIPLLLMSLSVGAALMLAADVFTWQRLVLAATLTTAYLLQIRFADEPKDFEHDNKHYPTRPVQRGVITLSELLVLRNIAIVVFFLAASLAGSIYVLGLALLQQYYSYLTRVEFYMRDWLRDHFIIYMLSHYFQLFILNWLSLTLLNIPTEKKPQYFGFAILMLAVVELARKTQEADNDKAGDTYSAVLGRRKAVSILLVVALTLMAYTAWILQPLTNSVVIYGMLLVGGLVIAWAGMRYYAQPNINNTKQLQAASLGLYFLSAITLMVGAVG